MNADSPSRGEPETTTTPRGLPLHEVFELEPDGGASARALDAAFGAAPQQALQEHLRAVARAALAPATPA